MQVYIKVNKNSKFSWDWYELWQDAHKKSFRALSDNYVKKHNLTESSSDNKLTEEERLVSKKSGEYKPVTVYTDPLTGKKIAPDVGWRYNPAADF